MRLSIKYLILLILFSFPLLMSAQAPSITIGDAKVDDLGMSKLLYRWGPNGALVIENAAMCFEMSLTYNAKNLAGKRIFGLVTACDKDGNELADRTGVAASLMAQTVQSANENGTFHFVMPQGWIITSTNKEAQAVNLFAQVFVLEDNGPKASKPLTLTGDALKIDNKNLPGKLMSDLFSGGSSGGGVGLGDLIGGLLGGGSSASSTQPCPACDGTRLCQNCDGDGFFDPYECRKCNSMPGVCRRCKGEGEITIKVDYNDSWF